MMSRMINGDWKNVHAFVKISHFVCVCDRPPVSTSVSWRLWRLIGSTYRGDWRKAGVASRRMKLGFIASRMR